VGVIGFRDALARAQEVELDLVKISDSDPIVCMLMDYGKFQYEQKNQANEAKK